MELEKIEYTHYAKFYGVPTYYNINTHEIVGRNYFYSLLLDVAVWIDQKWPSNPDGFPILLGKELEENNKFH